MQACRPWPASIALAVVDVVTPSTSASVRFIIIIDTEPVLCRFLSLSYSHHHHHPPHPHPFILTTDNKHRQLVGLLGRYAIWRDERSRDIS